MVRRRAYIVVLLALLLAACGGGGSSALKAGDETEIGTDPAEIGSHEHFGLTGFNPQGDEPVRFRAARLVGVPAGMKVLGMRAVRRTEPSTSYGWRGDLKSGMGADLEFHPVEDVVLKPGTRFDEEYYLVVTVTATKKGEFHTKGVEVDWKAGGRSGTTFFPYLVGLVVPG